MGAAQSNLGSEVTGPPNIAAATGYPGQRFQTCCEKKTGLMHVLLFGKCIVRAQLTPQECDIHRKLWRESADPDTVFNDIARLIAVALESFPCRGSLWAWMVANSTRNPCSDAVPTAGGGYSCLNHWLLDISCRSAAVCN